MYKQAVSLVTIPATEYPGCVQLAISVLHNHDKLANIMRLSQSILKNLNQS